MSTRQPIRKSVRFEVFKRDNFTCQYCGAKAPDVILHVDHINPVSKGGDNEIINLVTACQPCNLGKSDRALSDSSSINRQRAQLEGLNERREQLEMLLAWRDSMKELDQEAAGEVANRIEDHIPGYLVNDTGRVSVAKWLRKYSVSEILDAAEAAALKLPESIDAESVDAFFNSIPKLCAVRRLPEAEQRLRYARGILRNRVYVNERMVMTLMVRAVEAGTDPEEIVQLAKETPNWTAFRAEMEAVVNG